MMFCMALLSPFVVGQAIDTDLTFRFNQQLDLNRACFNNASYCSTLAVCNITIIYPDGEILVNDQTMTNQYSFHNISVINTDIDQLGRHQASMVCCDPANSLCGSDTFVIDITGDGFLPTTFPTQLSVLILGFGLITLSIFSDKLRLFKVVGGIMVMVMGAITLYPGWSNFNYSNIQGQLIGVSSIGLGFYFMVQDALSFDTQVSSFEQDEDGRFHG